MEEEPRAVREPSDSSRKLLRRIGDGEIPMPWHGGKLRYSPLAAIINRTPE